MEEGKKRKGGSQTRRVAQQHISARTRHRLQPATAAAATQRTIKHRLTNTLTAPAAHSACRHDRGHNHNTSQPRGAPLPQWGKARPEQPNALFHTGQWACITAGYIYLHRPKGAIHQLHWCTFVMSSRQRALHKWILRLKCSAASCVLRLDFNPYHACLWM